jgi:hypothetical protein
LEKINHWTAYWIISCLVNVHPKRWRIIAVYWYTTPSDYCPWFHNNSQRAFTINPIPTWYMVTSHTTLRAQCGEQRSRHKETQTVAVGFTHKKTITVMGIRL